MINQESTIANQVGVSHSHKYSIYGYDNDVKNWRRAWGNMAQPVDFHTPGLQEFVEEILLSPSLLHPKILGIDASTQSLIFVEQSGTIRLWNVQEPDRYLILGTRFGFDQAHKALYPPLVLGHQIKVENMCLKEDFGCTLYVESGDSITTGIVGESIMTEKGWWLADAFAKTFPCKKESEFTDGLEWNTVAQSMSKYV